MRNGNKFITKSLIDYAFGSYRTYEEWKPIMDRLVACFQKVLTVPMRNGNCHAEYHFWPSESVLTVPMRNGNQLSLYQNFTTISFLPYLWGMETSPSLLSSARVLLVLTVPMRNGNSRSDVFDMNDMNEFLPYLWGMETACDGRYWTSALGSYRTYEEWKQWRGSRARGR